MYKMNKFFKGFLFAFEGLITIFETQVNFRFHVVAAILVITMGYYYHISINEWLIIILCIGTVLMCEAFNTALEFLTDLASPAIHPLAKKAKDSAAAAVLIFAIVSVVVGIIIFLPKITNSI
jgi:diacylglycerol kinase